MYETQRDLSMILCLLSQSSVFSFNTYNRIHILLCVVKTFHFNYFGVMVLSVDTVSTAIEVGVMGIPKLHIENK